MSSARSIAAMPSLPQWSCAWGTGDGTSRRISLATDVCLLDHFAPLRVLVPDEPGEVSGRIRHQLDALRRELRLDVGIAQHAGRLGADALHDLRRHLGRHEETKPRIHGIAGQRFTDRRRITEIRKALRCRAAQELELAFLD